MRGSYVEGNTETISPALLAYLRAELRAPQLTFTDPPAAISGGYDTRIFAFRLGGAPPAWSGPLILRLLNPAHDPLRVLKERATQNTLAALGYPVPRVLTACADRGPLSGAFLVMERAPGRPLLDAQRVGASRVLAQAHARLHTLDADALLRALDEEGRAAGGGFDHHAITYDGYLTTLDRRIRQGPLEGLSRGMRWLFEHRPTPGASLVICHGDFHPQNLLVADGRVSAVLDWPNVVVAEREYDVASTRAILALTPIELSAVPAALRPLAALLRPVMVARYLSTYRRSRPLDPSRLRYYENASCMRGLVRAAEGRAAGAAPTNHPLDSSSFGDRIAARFTRLSGVPVALPARRH
ncbi:MAG: phosphotransferase [Candidatus Rokuibacteriota bacterium]